MNLAPLEQINKLANADQTSQKSPSPDALRKAAMQFEAVLLMQLTSILNNSSSENDGEESLFGNDGGTDLAKKMFSEQLATTMSESGGVGLADTILSQFGVSSSKKDNFSRSIAAVKDIKESGVTSNDFRDENNAPPVINKSGKFVPVNSVGFVGNAEDAEVISTFENEARTEGIEESVRNLLLDGKIVNSTRARIVPESSIAEDVQSVSMNETSSAAKTEGFENVSYRMPVSGRISSDFGTRFHPIDHKTKFHGGLDIAAPKGTPIGSAADGEVIFAGWKGGYGNMVVIRHADGKESRYGHAEKLFVREGEQVSAGQTIAAVGSTGKSTGPHLHFEIRENGELVNPRKILSNVLANRADR